eukprot:2797328-Prorocentrum_lima.AAC.1
MSTGRTTSAVFVGQNDPCPDSTQVRCERGAQVAPDCAIFCPRDLGGVVLQLRLYKTAGVVSDTHESLFLCY